MDRRSFLKSVGAAGLLPMLPLPAVSAIPATAASDLPAVTYKWAELIVRAHSKCNLSMLQRHLRLDAASAATLKSQLIRNGVISAQANAYGVHSAVKPLYDGAFIRPNKPVEAVRKKLTEATEKLLEQETPDVEKESEIRDLDKITESVSDQVESDCELREASGDGLQEEERPMT